MCPIKQGTLNYIDVGIFHTFCYLLERKVTCIIPVHFIKVSLMSISLATAWARGRGNFNY